MSEEVSDTHRTIAISAFVLALLTLVLSLHNFTRTTGLANGELRVDAAVAARTDQSIADVGARVGSLEARIGALETKGVAAAPAATEAVAEGGPQ